jgi:hypothetical protein
LGTLQIYAQEAQFSKDIGFNQLLPQQQAVFGHYIHVFKAQWYTVSWFGVLTIVAAVPLFLRERSKPV